MSLRPRRGPTCVTACRRTCGTTNPPPTHDPNGVEPTVSPIGRTSRTSLQLTHIGHHHGWTSDHPIIAIAIPDVSSTRPQRGQTCVTACRRTCGTTNPPPNTRPQRGRTNRSCHPSDARAVRPYNWHHRGRCQNDACSLSVSCRA